MSAIRRLTACTLVAFAAALPSTADAHHARHHHAAKAKLLPAHEKPGYAAEARAALLSPIDVGMGPVFPFDGFVLK